MSKAKPRVVIAMSGGVDSSVAAALLVEAGYQVEGVMLRLWSEPGDPLAESVNRCCTPDQVADASLVAGILGIPFRTLDVTDLFRRTVVQDFIDTYAHGQTPNPCVVCNQQIRFGFLLDNVRSTGAEYLATGHYARIRRDGDRLGLLRGVDSTKDQSYFLYTLGQSQLEHLLFPAGDFTKPEIRARAHQFGLPVATKQDSQDICFLADGDYRRFLRRYAPAFMQPGPILDMSGREIGTHQGVPAYTVGQRKGLRLSAPEPLYVLTVDPDRNAIIVGPRRAITRDQFTIRDTRWVSDLAPSNGTPLRAEVKIRYRSRPLSATLLFASDSGPGEGGALQPGMTTVRLDQARADITPGQAAVVYREEECLGGRHNYANGANSMNLSLFSPGFLFALLLATAYGAGFHLLFGGRLIKLLLYLLAAWMGFAIGQWAGATLGISLLDVGPVRTFAASLGAWLALVFSHWLGKDRQPDVVKKGR